MDKELSTELYRIVGPTELELMSGVIVYKNITIRNPTIEVCHKAGYWPKELQVIPEPEEGYKIFDEGYELLGEGQDKYIHRNIRKLLIVDNKPIIDSDQVIEDDYWEEQGDKYVHVYPVWTVVIPPIPEIDENTQYYKGSEWQYNHDTMEKTKVYIILERVDEPPVLDEGQEIIEDHWEEQDDKYVHVYSVRYIVDNPPELEEGQQVLNWHWEDDGVTRTKIYDRIRFVVDNPPELEEGQQIIEKTEEDDGTTVTYIYKVRYVVDNRPELEEGQQIISERWEDDGVTMTKIYEVRFVVDNPPELDDNHYIHEDHWEDDGVTRTHVYVVITVIDERPDVGENQELEDLGWELDLESRTRTHKYRVWTIVDNGPTPPSGQMWDEKDPVRVKDEATLTINVVYSYVPYPVLRVSKFDLEVALGKMGKLTAFQAFIAALPDIDFGNGEVRSVKHFYETANDLKTDNPLCVPYIEAGAKALGLTINEVFRILKACQVKIPQ